MKSYAPSKVYTNPDLPSASRNAYKSYTSDSRRSAHVLPPDSFKSTRSPFCFCTLSAKEATVKSNKNGNAGKLFFTCTQDFEDKCNFFEWSESWRIKLYAEKLKIDQEKAAGEVLTIRKKKGKLSSPEKVTSSINSTTSSYSLKKVRQSEE